MTPELRAADRRSLVDTVVEQLRNQLAERAWRVGDRIPTEHELADRLGVGRNTVREAVRVLVHAGLLESRQGQGTFVRSTADPSAVLRGMKQANVRDVLELRIALETEAARLAATRRTRDDLRRLRAGLRALHQHGPQPEGAVQADDDIDFHLAVVAAAHNTALTEVYGYFSSSVREALVASLGQDGMPRLDLETHTALVDAIESGDPQAAETAARNLLMSPLRAVEALIPHDTDTRP
ncbi:FadR/GntR family transcriptional regulator [Streptantibioticus rubrisoli]|uniref:FadR family transcriptional regulator n=1 Tax=Streptantibioticus rubrisoli TaxID=1387313 RepID=A0ABT1P9M0_9ACTN|nr:FadR/GntR family transcriptional regulator [Streptantibioticus rubrisoli]MCQ4042064.1 FadR family transcriptional regulator [Streptantibioticus rubrisoli]